MRTLKQIFLTIFILAVSLGVFYAGYRQGSKNAIYEARKNPPKVEIINQSPSGEKYNFGLFWEVWDMVSKDFLFRPVDPQKMMDGAIKGVEAYFAVPATTETSESSQSSPSGSN